MWLRRIIALALIAALAVSAASAPAVSRCGAIAAAADACDSAGADCPACKTGTASDIDPNACAAQDCLKASVFLAPQVAAPVPAAGGAAPDSPRPDRPTRTVRPEFPPPR